MDAKQSRMTCKSLKLTFAKRMAGNFALTVVLPELLPSFNPIFSQELSYGCTVHQLEL